MRRGKIVRVVKALDLEVNLILLDSEIPKAHKKPNFDRLAKSIEISLGTASFRMRSGSDSRGSANARAHYTSIP